MEFDGEVSGSTTKVETNRSSDTGCKVVDFGDRLLAPAFIDRHRKEVIQEIDGKP